MSATTRPAPLPSYVTKRVQTLAKRPGVHFYERGALYHIAADGKRIEGRAA